MQNNVLCLSGRRCEALVRVCVRLSLSGVN